MPVIWHTHRCIWGKCGGARSVTVTVVGNGHGDLSLNPRRDCLHFPECYYS